MEAMGRYPNSGAITITATNMKTECVTAATGERPPQRTFVAVLAIAPVAASLLIFGNSTNIASVSRPIEKSPTFRLGIAVAIAVTF